MHVGRSAITRDRFQRRQANRAFSFLPTFAQHTHRLAVKIDVGHIELAALDVADVDLYSESVRVLGKGRKERECPIGLPALEAISRYRAAANVHAGSLFRNK